jgi:hypothetical protein
VILTTVPAHELADGEPLELAPEYAASAWLHGLEDPVIRVCHVSADVAVLGLVACLYIADDVREHLAKVEATLDALEDEDRRLAASLAELHLWAQRAIDDVQRDAHHAAGTIGDVVERVRECPREADADLLVPLEGSHGRQDLFVMSATHRRRWRRPWTRVTATN